MLGLNLANFFSWQKAQGATANKLAGSRGFQTAKSVIMVFLSGGPPHQDMVDLKPDAPIEVRGEFRPIRTNVPGIDICEHLPRRAAKMDKFAIIRSIVGAEERHAAFQCMTGRRFGGC